MVAVLLTLAIASGATLAAWRFSPWQPSTWLASQFRADWETAENESLKQYARQLAALGDAGWRVLVAGLCSSRPEVRHAAQQGIEDLIQSWQSQPTDIPTPQASRIAQLLAESLPQTDLDALGRFAELAERLLDLPSAEAGGLDRVYYCERVLRAAKDQGWPRPDHSEPAPQPPAMAEWNSEPSSSPKGIPNEDPVSAPAFRSELVESATAATGVAPPSEELPPSVAPGDGSLGLRDTSNETPPVPSLTSAAPAEPLAPVREEERPRLDWPKMELSEVIQHLRTGAPLLEVLVELRRRGLDERNVQVARAAADANPENRLQLVRAIIELPGIDSTGWLLVLARDESPRVRAAAVQMLSTASDPRIRRQLEDLEQTETDSGVRTALQNARETSR